jgi:hypothetical protein
MTSPLEALVDDVDDCGWLLEHAHPESAKTLAISATANAVTSAFFADMDLNMITPLPAFSLFISRY